MCPVPISPYKFCGLQIRLRDIHHHDIYEQTVNGRLLALRIALTALGTAKESLCPWGVRSILEGQPSDKYSNGL